MANTTMESFHRANVPVKLQRFLKAHSSSSGKPTDTRAIVVGDEVVSAMERTASHGDFRANLSKGGNGRSINLSDAETEMCIKAAKAVGLEFAGVDFIREKMGHTYVTEVNGNLGTSIIDITKKNYFVDLIKFFQLRSSKTIETPVTLTNEDTEDKKEKENEQENALRNYNRFSLKEKEGALSYNEYGLMSFYRRHFGMTK